MDQSNSRESGMLIRIMDVETTGMESTDAVVQIGQCDVRIVDGVGTVGMPSSMFVNPGRPIPAEARAIHHIRDKDVAGAPSPEVGLAQLMAGPPDAFCAHNNQFDRMFFAGGDRPWICSLKVARRVWPDAPRHGNQVLRYHLGIDDREGFEAWHSLPAHRAGPDAYITAWLICEALKCATVDQMIEWSSQPSLLPGKIGFGKHRGALWQELPPDYLAWIADKSELDADTKFTARHHLKRRMADAR